MAYWISDSYWMCDKHFPSARLLASSERCWSNCGTVRPPTHVTSKRGLVVTPKILAAPPPVTTETPLPTPSVPTSRTLEKGLVEEGGMGEEPSAQERRRGATRRVACLHCKQTLWRRPKDVTVDAEFFCSNGHRAAFKSRA